MRLFALVSAWMTVTVALGALLGWSLKSEGKALYLPGPTSDGHHQIEEQCMLCHTPFAGVRQDACLACHGDELDAMDDSHPPSKFLDPRRFDLVARFDARLCITCHREHQPEQDRGLGVTQPVDFCVHCHDDIGTERESHRGLAFTGCQDTGCHNFHDNRALNQDFLERHEGEPALLPSPAVPAPAVSQASHQGAGITCDDCHRQEGTWRDDPGDASCAGCHSYQSETFGRGRHGMRAAAELSPMGPDRARLPMAPAARGRELGCTSCHGAHEFDTRRAAVEACLDCHADRHSLTYLQSPHHDLWLAELAGELPPGAGVSCATCHLPRVHGKPNHNQSETLRPPEKMVRAVCGHCHGVEFALDALADRELGARNYRGEPAPRRSLRERKSTR